MIPHYFVEIDELIIKMYTVWGFEIVFHKIIEFQKKFSKKQIKKKCSQKFILYVIN
jgi:hypothetical protein